MSRAICQSVSPGTRPCQLRGGRTEADMCCSYCMHTPAWAPDQPPRTFSFRNTWPAPNARSNQMTLASLNQVVSGLMSARCTHIHMADHSLIEIKSILRLKEFCHHGAWTFDHRLRELCNTSQFCTIFKDNIMKYHPVQRNAGIICAIVDSFYLWPISSWPPQWMKTPQLAIWGGHKSMTINPQQFNFLFLNPPPPRESALLVQLLIIGMPPAPSNISFKSLPGAPSTGNFPTNIEEKEIEIIFCWKSDKIEISTKPPLFPIPWNKFLQRWCWWFPSSNCQLTVQCGLFFGFYN